MKKQIPLDAMSRRNFLLGGTAAATSATMLSTLMDLRMTRSALAAAGNTDGYKALVCVFLSGGIDSHNLLAPYEPAEYSDYVAIRGATGTPGGLGADGDERENRGAGAG